MKGGADPLAKMAIWDNPTALWRAVVSSQTNAVLVLLQAGVDINLPHRNRLVVLHGAEAFGQPEMIRFLIDHGADLEIRDAYGETPISLAEKNKNYEILEYMKKKLNQNQSADFSR